MEFRRFWHLEKIGYAEDYIKNVLIADYYTQIGETFNPSNYSIENLPVSRVEGAPDLSHGPWRRANHGGRGELYLFSHARL